MTKELDPELLRQLLDYNPDTGELVWKERTKETHPKDHGRRIFNSRYAGTPAFASYDAYGYKQGAIYNKKYKAHRVIWAMMAGAWPKDQIDHIDGERSNNRIENLREATALENQRNKKLQSNNKSGYTGVVWREDLKKWWAYIRADGKNLHLGFFDNIEDAIAARKKADIKYGFHENHGRS